MSITAPACASCVLGATSSSLLSFTYHAIETITVKVVPHITVYNEGSSTSRTTNYVSITQTETDYVGGGSNRNASKTYSNLDELTWTVGDATLTYPTTYVQYLGFAGSAVASGDAEKCATGSDGTSLSLPTSTDAASFIYPYTLSGATSLPEPLLEYLQGQAAFAAQFSGQALTGCAGLDYIPPETTSGEPYASGSSAPPVSSTASYTTTTASFGNYTRTTKIRTGGPPGPPKPSSVAPVPSAPAASSHAPVYSPPATLATNTHSTAFVIQPITAQKPIVTTISGGSDHHHTGGDDAPHHTTKTTKHHNNHTPGGYGHSSGGGDHVTPAGQNQPTGKPHHVYTVGSSEVTGNPRGPVTIGHHTLHHGETMTLGHGPSATTVALEGHGKHEHLVVNGKTEKGHLEFAPTPGAQSEVSSAIITSDGHKITAIYSGGSVVLQDGSSKTTVGAGSKVTFDGQTIKVPHSGGSVKVNGDKVPLTAVASSQAVITAGGHTITAVESGNSVILRDGSKTITVKDGSQTKFEGHSISVGPSGSAVVVDGKTVTLSAVPTPEATITAGGHTITAVDMSGSVILEDGHSTTTVKDGKTVVFEGQTFKIPTHGTSVVVNGRTIQLTTHTSATTTGVGGYVNSGLGGSGHTPTSTARLADTNAAASASLAAVRVMWSALLATLGSLLLL